MVKKPDFEALFRASPYPYLVMSVDLTIVGANDAYLRSTGRTEEDIVGKYVFDAFPPNPDDPDSTNIHEVKTSLERAIAKGKETKGHPRRFVFPELNQIEVLWKQAKYFWRRFVSLKGDDLLQEFQSLMKDFGKEFTINFA